MSRHALIERLQRRLGLDPQSIGEVALRHALDEAGVELAAADSGELLARIDRDEAEWQRFVDCMVVPETWLFRVPEQFDDLLRFARELPSTRRPLRILSLPCASGEEVWSIAATLAAGGFAPASFEVLGIDVSARAIEAARSARYRPQSLRGRTLDNPWLHFEGEWLTPVPALRRSVRFRVGNALAPGLAAGERFDVVFCRNLIIYLDEAARRQALQHLLQLLASDGMLLAGQAEVLSSIDSRLQPLPGYGPLSFGLLRSSSAPAGPAPQRTRPPSARPPPPRTTPAPASAPTAVAAAVDPLQAARSAADAGELDAARSLIRSELDMRPESVPAWFLLGVVEMAANALEAADQAFARTSYLDREDREALRYRIAIAEGRGLHEQARQLNQRLARMRAPSGETP